VPPNFMTIFATAFPVYGPNYGFVTTSRADRDRI
jgi:hypothetical protein